MKMCDCQMKRQTAYEDSEEKYKCESSNEREKRQITFDNIKKNGFASYENSFFTDNRKVKMKT